MTRKAAGLGSSGHSGGGGGGGSARPVSASRVSLKGLEGGKLTAALLHAAATAEARHLCFDHVSVFFTREEGREELEGL